MASKTTSYSWLITFFSVLGVKVRNYLAFDPRLDHEGDWPGEGNTSKASFHDAGPVQSHQGSQLDLTDVPMRGSDRSRWMAAHTCRGSRRHGDVGGHPDTVRHCFRCQSQLSQAAMSVLWSQVGIPVELLVTGMARPAAGLPATGNADPL